MRLTKPRFGGFYVKEAEQAAGDIAPREALGMIEQQSE
jgi:hypothetical protein